MDDSKIKRQMSDSQWQIKERVPSQSKFFDFHAVFSKNFANDRPEHPYGSWHSAPFPSGK